MFYALKRVELHGDNHEKFLKEAKAFSQFDHKNVIRYHHTFKESPPLGEHFQLEHTIYYVTCLELGGKIDLIK
jgi:hypothetical protein